MRFASLGSGSKGNALIVEVGKTRLLLDCGLTVTEVTSRLARRGLEVDDLDAIVVTHEHSDHLGGVTGIARRNEIPIYLTYGTLTALNADREATGPVTVINGDTPFAIGDIELRPFPVPHDAHEPVQFVFSDGKHCLGVLTDTGSSTPHIERMLSGLDALMLECNHDLDMLARGNYPAQLKQRISGRFGHLDNDSAAQLLRNVDCSRLQYFVAAHLSQQNNTPELARMAIGRALNCTPDWFQGDANRVIYSCRVPGVGSEYGWTMLMQANTDGKTRSLIYGERGRHVYYGCTSPDDKYVVFGRPESDGGVDSEMAVIRLADTPMVTPEDYKGLKALYPNAKDGPMLRLGLTGFEPHWTYTEIETK